MADINKWIGGAREVAQVTDVTPANVEVGDVFKIDASDDLGHSYEITYTASAASVKDVEEGLKAAADAASSAGYAPWTDIAASEDDTILTLTASTAGKPFYVSCSTTDGGGNDTQALTPATATANSGPNDINTPDNWSLGTVPVATNEVVIPCESDVTDDLLYGLDQSSVALASWTKEEGCALVVGCDNAPLKIDADNVTISGTEATYINVANSTGAVTVRSASETYLTGSSNTTLRVSLDTGNVLKVAMQAGQSDSYTDIKIDGSGTVYIGSGVTVTHIYIAGDGVVHNYAGCTTLTKSGTMSEDPTLYHEQGAITTVIDNRGTTHLNATETIGTYYKGTDAYLDCSDGFQARTITDLYLYSPRFLDPNKVVNWTNLYLSGCGIGSELFDLGTHIKLTRAAM